MGSPYHEHGLLPEKSQNELGEAPKISTPRSKSTPPLRGSQGCTTQGRKSLDTPCSAYPSPASFQEVVVFLRETGGRTGTTGHGTNLDFTFGHDV
jgi:hypothetical protein